MNYHIWCTTAEYCLGGTGQERDLLEPGHTAYWTGRKGLNKKDDIVFLYRKKPYCDIKYIVKLLEDADTPSAEYRQSWVERGWKYGCGIVSLLNIPNALHIHTMKADPVLKDWGSIRGNFQGGAHRIPVAIVLRIKELLVEANPDCKDIIMDPREIIPRIDDVDTYEKSLGSSGSIIYFIKDDPYVKIGVTDNLTKRVSQMQTGNPRVLTIMATMPSEDPYKMELELHTKFKKYNYQGEWFILSDEIKEFIEKVRKLQL